MNFLFNNKRIYLDYASTTPVSPRVKRAMDPFWSKMFFNPNGLYKGSVASKESLENFRKNTGKFFGVAPDEVIFTSGGTESDNLAILGSISAFKRNNPGVVPHVITSSIEHPAVLELIKFLESNNEIRVSYIPVDINGVVLLEEIKKQLSLETILVSIMYVNNEVGSIQPIHEIVKMVRHFKKHAFQKNSTYPLVHTDASQAVLYQDVHMERLGVDLLSCNAGKIYGPKGVGVLIKKRRVQIDPLFYGGNQEFGIRPGTQALPLIAGLSQALEDAAELKDKEIQRVTELHDFLVVELQKKFPQIEIHGSLLHKIPGILNISYPDIESDLLVLELDALDVEVSSKTACKYDDPDESYVLKAMKGTDADEEMGTVRISIGRYTSKRDLLKFLEAFSKVVDKYKSFQESLNKNIK